MNDFKLSIEKKWKLKLVKNLNNEICYKMPSGETYNLATLRYLVAGLTTNPYKDTHLIILSMYVDLLEFIKREQRFWNGGSIYD